MEKRPANQEEETTQEIPTKAENQPRPLRYYRFPILPDHDDNQTHQTAEERRRSTMDGSSLKLQEQNNLAKRRKVVVSDDDDMNSAVVAANLKRMRNYSKEDIAEEKRLGVTTRLSLYGEKHDTNLPKRRKLFSDDDIINSTVAGNLRRMRNYSKEDIAEEKRLGVTTRLSLYDDPWKMTKKLTMSDLGGNCRLMLELKWAKKYFLPYLDIKQVESEPGVPVTVLDFDTDTEHVLRFKLWKSSHCYVLKGGWIKDFVKRRELKKNNQIGMICVRPFMGAQCSSLKLYFRVLQRAALLPQLKDVRSSGVVGGGQTIRQI